MVGIENIFVKYIKHRERLDKAKIYKLIDNSNDKVYIGSTCRSLNQRLSEHKSGYKRFLKGLYYNTKSFDIIKNNDYKIDLIENCKIKTKEELIERERYYIENNDCLNKIIPGRTEKEWRDANKDKILIKRGDYYNDNKDKIIKSQKAYNNKNKDELNEKFDCECGGKYLYSHKAHRTNTIKHQNFLQSLK